MAQDEVIRHAVVIGGSAGSLDVLLQILPHITTRDGCVFIIVLHRKADGENLLCELLSRRTELQLKEVEDKDELNAGTIYLAPADYHLLVEQTSSFSLDAAEKVHYSRPSIDVTFDSVAEHFGARSIGVLLSGASADGAEGLATIRAVGGITMVQDPADAEVAFMPQQAINAGAAMHIVPGAELGHFINRLLLHTQ